MPRTAHTIARTHKGKWVLLSTPDDPIDAQKKAFLSFPPVHAEIAQVEYYERDSDVAYAPKIIRTPAAHKVHEDRRESERKAWQDRDAKLKTKSEKPKTETKFETIQS